MEPYPGRKQTKQGYTMPEKQVKKQTGEGEQKWVCIPPVPRAVANLAVFTLLLEKAKGGDENQVFYKALCAYIYVEI